MNCKARLEIGWIEEDFQGDTPEDIVREVEKVQDLDCLLRMGYEEEGKRGRKELDKLAAFLEKYRSGKLTGKDLAALEINLSIGSIKCLSYEETDL
jgi:hypothetical protein